ncbi:MAG: UDP-N-acetylmuramoyl-L-alanyl-D-glutamate--2,6-diaminopimelate ligase [Rhodoferax sp.]|nr:UDP-N-acetylmuramoyl-L-alanyl-D-glutamate--2,6-diaminopimelate ligase [Rhodoferax sp.]
MQRLEHPRQAAEWLRGRARGDLCTDSRQLAPGDAFLAWPGAATDARRFVADVLGRGASACLVEQQGVEAYDWGGDPRIAVYPGLKAASGPVAAAWYGEPSQALDVLAVTGTNGKTSTVWWLAQALSKIEHPRLIPCGMVGTLGIGRVSGPDPADADLLPSGLTTPDPVLLQRSLRHFVQQGLRACAMEASSIGIAEDRLAGTRIHTALFTNLTQDHLDYHGTMTAYWETKIRLFGWQGLKAGVVNVDDRRGAALASGWPHPQVDLWTVSARRPARLQATDLVHHSAGLAFTVCEGEQREPLQTATLGSYNVNNLLGVIAGLRSLGVSLADAVRACAGLSAVPGRLQQVSAPGRPLAVIDYAHTPDALAKALQALRPLVMERRGRLWCVFGCGGDRDPGKRPLMGQAAGSHADTVLVTNDNPRSEPPEVILVQILSGLKGHPDCRIEPDRATAIAQALRYADADDVVLIAGKGHETYQEVAGERRPFSDLQQVRLALQPTERVSA